MTRPRDWLDRFRRVATPGGPALSAVPAESSPTAAELQQVFAALAPTVRTVRDIGADADAEAARMRAASEDEARQLVAAARARAPSARIEALAAELRAGRRQDMTPQPVHPSDQAADQAQLRIATVADTLTRHVLDQLIGLTGVELSQPASGRTS